MSFGVDEILTRARRTGENGGGIEGAHRVPSFGWEVVCFFFLSANNALKSVSFTPIRSIQLLICCITFFTTKRNVY